MHGVSDFSEDCRLDQYTEEQKIGLVSSCPANVFEYDSLSQQVMLVNSTDCIFCKECIYTAEEYRKQPEDILAVDIKHSNKKFTFTVETTGALLASEVVRDALVVLGEKINKLQQSVREYETRK